MALRASNNTGWHRGLGPRSSAPEAIKAGPQSTIEGIPVYPTSRLAGWAGRRDAPAKPSPPFGLGPQDRRQSAIDKNYLPL